MGYQTLNNYVYILSLHNLYDVNVQHIYIYNLSINIQRH